MKKKNWAFRNVQLVEAPLFYEARVHFRIRVRVRVRVRVWVWVQQLKNY